MEEAAGGAARTGRSAVRSLREGRAHRWSGLGLIAPALALVAAFTVYPFGYAVYQSLRLTSPILGDEFVGAENYVEVFTSPYFLDAARTTLGFAAASVVLLVCLGTAVALLVNERFRGNVFVRAAMLLPWAIPASAAGVMWKWIFRSGSGALNVGLYSLGVGDDPIPWLTTPSLAQMAIVIVFVWTQLPLVSILLMAAIQGIPEDLYDAAAVDGASASQRFRFVTLPSIRPMLLIVATYELLVAIAAFDLTYSLTGGGPGTSTTMLTYFVWTETFNELNFGQGAALAIIVAVVSLVGIFLILRAMPDEALLGEER